ncbi:uncharacterized protein LOC144713934 [Wolffia australiana]
MVSIEGPLCDTQRKAMKRKWKEEEEEEKGKERVPKELKLWKEDIDLNFDSPLPPEWQRCLDIKSGEVHFYNMRTQRRTSKDPRRSTTVEQPGTEIRDAGLDLELNLTCEAPSRVAEGGEMVAAVCGRCYMLVMMSRSSPSCPNCKFSQHPKDMPLLKPPSRALVL